MLKHQLHKIAEDLEPKPIDWTLVDRWRLEPAEQEKPKTK